MLGLSDDGDPFRVLTIYIGFILSFSGAFGFGRVQGNGVEGTGLRERGSRAITKKKGGASYFGNPGTF